MLQYTFMTYCIKSYYWSVRSHNYLLRDYCTKLIDIKHRYSLRPYKCNDCNSIVYFHSVYTCTHICPISPFICLLQYSNYKHSFLLQELLITYLSSSPLLGMEVCCPYGWYEMLSVMNSEVSASCVPKSYVCAKHKSKLALVQFNCIYTVL
jgi:hypothetical protein